MATGSVDPGRPVRRPPASNWRPRGRGPPLVFRPVDGAVVPAIVQEADSAAGAAVLFEPQVRAIDNFDDHLPSIPKAPSFACLIP